MDTLINYLNIFSFFKQYVFQKTWLFGLTLDILSFISYIFEKEEMSRRPQMEKLYIKGGLVNARSRISGKNIQC